MDQRKVTTVGKFLCLVLRHKPEAIDLQLDSGGWANVDELLQKLEQSGRPLTKEELVSVVNIDNKQRFALTSNGALIRASQGHSIAIDLGYAPTEPPARLWHGTAKRFISSIFSTGLLKMNRHHVHLSADRNTAYTVGKRHGSPLVLRVDARAMHNDGYGFFLSANGVWLTNNVPVSYLHEEPDLVEKDRR